MPRHSCIAVSEYLHLRYKNRDMGDKSREVGDAPGSSAPCSPVFIQYLYSIAIFACMLWEYAMGIFAVMTWG